MKSKIITERDTEALKISTLPTRPTAPEAFGGRGYSSVEMKAAFDRLPLFIVERLNLLIEDITGVGENSVAAAILTEIREGHTLRDLFRDVRSGELAAYLSLGDKTLLSAISEIRSEIESITKRL